MDKEKKPKKTKVPEEIKVEKGFLMKILKTVEDLGKEVKTIKEDNVKPKTVKVEAQKTPPEQDYVFQCHPLIAVDRLPLTPEEAIFFSGKSTEFQKKLKTLMKEYKVMQITAVFLKKL